MSKITDEMRRDAEREWLGPRHKMTVLEYIESPEFNTVIMFYRVDYPGTNYSVTRIKLHIDGSGGYDNQVDSSGDIMSTVNRAPLP